MKHLSTYDASKYKVSKSAPEPDSRLVELVKLLARSAAEEDNKRIQTASSQSTRPVRKQEDSK